MSQKAFMFTWVNTRTHSEREKRVISEIAAVSQPGISEEWILPPKQAVLLLAWELGLAGA